MDTNTDNTTDTKEASDQDLHRQGLSTIQAVIELLKALATKWGWADWLIKLLAVAGIIVAALLGTACNITAEQVQQAEAVHRVYHTLTGKPCILDSKPATVNDSGK